MAGRAGAVALMAAEREWIEYECYGPIWQGITCWKSGRIDPSHDWPLMDGETLRWTQAFIDNVGDFSDVTDWRATHVREVTKWFGGVHEDGQRETTQVTTTRTPVREWADADRAAEVESECHDEHNEFYEDDDSDE